MHTFMGGGLEAHGIAFAARAHEVILRVRLDLALGHGAAAGEATEERTKATFGGRGVGSSGFCVCDCINIGVSSYSERIFRSFRASYLGICRLGRWR